MTIALFLHVGYLVAWDDYGLAFGWGVPRQPRKLDGKVYRRYVEMPLPWWTQPSKLKNALVVRKLRRLARKS